MIIHLRDADGALLAFRSATDTEWFDPHGGVFTDRDQRDITAFAEGVIDDNEFGCQGLRLTVSFAAVVRNEGDNADGERNALSIARDKDIARYHEVAVIGARYARSALDPMTRKAAPRWVKGEAERAVAALREAMALAAKLGDPAAAEQHRAAIARLDAGQELDRGGGLENGTR